MVEAGMALTDVRALDLLTFEALARSLKRILAIEAKETAWMQMHAAQATFEAMKEWLTKYDKVLADYKIEPGDDFEAFMKSKYAKGV